MKTTFWTYFTSGYGIIWLSLLIISLISSTHINAGSFGIFGFPIIAAIYAAIRRSNDLKSSSQEIVTLPPRMTEFLTLYPEFLNSPQNLRDSAFRKWLIKNTGL